MRRLGGLRGLGDASGAAGAGPVYLANGRLTGSAAGAGVDLSGLAGLSENAAPGNLLGGIGSGLAWAGGTTFIGLPDRDSNAITFNAAIDNSASYMRGWRADPRAAVQPRCREQVGGRRDGDPRQHRKPRSEQGHGGPCLVRCELRAAGDRRRARAGELGQHAGRPGMLGVLLRRRRLVPAAPGLA